MEISELIKPLGIVTYVFVVLTFLAGLFRAKLKLKIKHHKALAWVAVTLASLHGLLVIILY
jgi:Mg2+ and Co2+ transporter CorA